MGINFPKISSQLKAITCVVWKQDGVCTQVHINIKVLKGYEAVSANVWFPINIHG